MHTLGGNSAFVNPAGQLLSVSRCGLLIFITVQDL